MHSFWGFHMSGSVTYNGHGMDEFVPQRASAYISQKWSSYRRINSQGDTSLLFKMSRSWPRYGRRHFLILWTLIIKQVSPLELDCWAFSLKKNYVEMLAELSIREKEANIKPDPDVDIFMKVKTSQWKFSLTLCQFWWEMTRILVFCSTGRAGCQCCNRLYSQGKSHFLNYKFNEEMFPAIQSFILQILQILRLDICVWNVSRHFRRTVSELLQVRAKPDDPEPSRSN